ncbi:hypothetical protein C8F04DRAFT_925770, partial [Mycena alexandri]
MSTSRSKRPNHRRSGSMEFGRLVAAMTTTFEWEPNAVIKAVFTFSRLGAIESISLMKMMAGEFLDSANASRRLLSPAFFLFMILGPLMKKKNTASGLDT